MMPAAIRTTMLTRMGTNQDGVSTLTPDRVAWSPHSLYTPQRALHVTDFLSYRHDLKKAADSSAATGTT